MNELINQFRDRLLITSTKKYIYIYKVTIADNKNNIKEYRKRMTDIIEQKSRKDSSRSFKIDHRIPKIVLCQFGKSHIFRLQKKILRL